MTQKNNRVCVVCNKQYRYCPSCNEDWNKPTWMVLFHDENCKNIYTYTNDYSHGDMTKEDAMTLLNKCDLSKLECFQPIIKKTIEGIIASDDPATKKSEEQNEVAQEQETRAENVETSFHEKKISKKHKKNRY